MTTVVKMIFKKILLAMGFACFLLLILAVYYKNVVMNPDRTLMINGHPFISNVASTTKIIEGLPGDVIIVNVPLIKTSNNCWTDIGHTITNKNIFYTFPIGASSKMAGEFVANHLIQLPDFLPIGDYNINTFYKSECEGTPGIEITRVPSIPFMVKK